MLDAYIIERIRQEKQERLRRKEQERPRLELPLYEEPYEPPKRDGDEDEGNDERGVIIIEL